MLVAAAMLLLVATAVAHSAPAAPRLVATSPAEVRFEVDAPEATFAPLAADSEALLLALEGYDLTGAVGSPGLPSRIVLVAVPPTGEVRVRGVAQEISVREGVLLAPIPDVMRDRERTIPVYQRSDEAYAARGSQAAERARLIGVGWLRNQRVARVQVLPADYDAAARLLTLARRIEVVVTVTPCARVVTPAERIDPFERVYARLLVNYEQGKDWRRPAGRRGGEGLFGPAGGARLETPFRVMTGDTVYAGRQWVKIAISQPGLYRVDYGTLRNLKPFRGAVVKNADLRLFTWRSPLPVLPEGDYCDSCAYGEVPIGTPGGDDVVFSADNANFFYFFAMGPSGWANLYNPGRPDTSYLNHPFETRNYYYLTVASALQPITSDTLRIPLDTADIDTLAGPPVVPTTFPERIHYEQSNEYFPDSPPVPNGTSNASGTVDTLSWQKWFWTTLGRGQNAQVQVDLPGADLGQSVQLRLKAWGLVRTVIPNCPLVMNALDVSLNGTALGRLQWYSKGSVTYDRVPLPSPKLTGNTVALSLPNLSSNVCSRVGLAWVDAFYARKLEPVSDSLTFVTTAGTGRAVYRIGPFSSATPPRLFDVTDAFSPREINGFEYLPLDATHHQLAFATAGTKLRRYIVVPDARFPRLLGPSVFEAPGTSLTDLRKLSADYVVIYYDGFGAAAESLAAWRRYHLPLEGASAPFDTATVPISAIYDQFSGGRTDPLAIRNFLRAVFLKQGGDVPANDRKPSFVMLLGDASYDYKNRLGKAVAGQPGCLLPTYDNGYDAYVLGGYQFTTDDWLLNVDDAGEIIPDFFGGRLPVGDAATAMDVVRSKVLFYERQAPFGDYRNRVMLIADDNFQCKSSDAIGWGHLQQTAGLDELHTPAHIDRAYVYLHTYPSGAASCTKPAAKAEIRTNLQDGVVMFNYIGHGSPFQLSDEAVMIETDVGTLSNGPRYPLFVAASCDVGLFNDPTQTSLGERMVTTPAGGAIAVISSTQLAFSTSNARLNGYIYDQIFDRAVSSGGQYHLGLAEALLVAKEIGSGFGSLTNDMKYQLMGDAGTRLNLPRLWVDLAFKDTLGNAITQVARGQTVKFTGRVLDAPGGSPVALHGTASVLIEDSQPLATPPGAPGVEYLYRAGPVYRADVAVVAGALEGRLVMPMEAREGTLGRIRAYATGRAPGQVVDTDAVGSLSNAIVAGTAPASDTEGPRIALSFAGGAFEVRADATLNVDLYDPSGILITGHSPQNGIIVTVDGNSTTRVDITSSFRCAANSYQGGRATFQLPNLSQGPHRVRVSAADNLASGFGAVAHRSSAEIEFLVVASTSLNVARAYLFPDPARSRGPGGGGQFVVDAPGAALNVLLRIYTVSGRLVRTLKSFGGVDQAQLSWDGLDDEREPLANGVYLFKVSVNAREADGSSNPKAHAVAEGRFVVLNP